MAAPGRACCKLPVASRCSNDLSISARNTGESRPRHIEGGIGLEAAVKDRQTTEDVTFVRREQLRGTFQHCPDAGMPRGIDLGLGVSKMGWSCSSASRHLLKCTASDGCRRKLDGQWHACYQPADGDHSLLILSGQGRHTLHLLEALQEQPGGAELHQVPRAWQRVGTQARQIE